MSRIITGESAIVSSVLGAGGAIESVVCMFIGLLIHMFYVAYSPMRASNRRPVGKGFAKAVCLTIVSKKGTKPFQRQA
ncbi:hypothetical protein [Pseudooctadecabacter jejudonensis]|uniref:hypothetical protein n=1 Tax=Pseudooctadecabacter jejudonensis TaxID=1391910 RepID=UPI00190E6DAE|nr:hypothetical protein [Pseudooctadecabacter jejudonensis]